MPPELRLGGRTEDRQVEGRGNDIPSSGTSLSDRSPIVQNYMIGSDHGDVSTHNKRASCLSLNKSIHWAKAWIC